MDLIDSMAQKKNRTLTPHEIDHLLEEIEEEKRSYTKSLLATAQKKWRSDLKKVLDMG